METPSKFELYAEDAAEQLRRWDAGDIIWTIEMGGLGPGYEQAIQIAAIELVRDNLGKPLPKDTDGVAWAKWGDSTLHRLADHYGWSGAQWGAACFLAVRWLKEGPKALMERADLKHRHIQCSKNFPKPPESKA